MSYNVKTLVSCLLCIFYNIIVTGDANFSMNYTSLTVGGFIQPSIARSLIELPGNAEKLGLKPMLSLVFPRPVYSQFATLEPINNSFTDKIPWVHVCTDFTNKINTDLNAVDTLAKLWRKTTLQNDDIPNRRFTIPQQREDEVATFRKKYDET